MQNINTLGKYKTCTGCGACENICPRKAIIMLYNEEGFLYPVIQKDLCVQCGKCERVCPVIEKDINGRCTQLCLVAKSKAYEPDSSSGGIFVVVAKHILEGDGVVFGAAYDKQFRVVHSCITDKKDLYRLQGSKYVQSRIGHTFQQAEKYLQKGRWVLFSGTACQIAGLKKYLSKPYEKLICMDIVCHGVPAPRVWEKYLENFHKKSKISRINFRNEKDTNVKEFSIDFLNKSSYKKAYPQDAYIWGFCYSLFLRKSCYNCKFKKMERVSDFTVGDAWGMEKYAKALFQKEGKTSIILVNTEKGERFLHEIEKDLDIQEVKAEWIIKNNKMLVYSTGYNKNRELFFAELKKRRFKGVMKKYCTKAFKKGIFNLWEI